ncbi:MAG: ABC transporter permease [Chloroflexi bacterium]|nr:ABC transporter permease [Chloroflexota bacterium]
MNLLDAFRIASRSLTASKLRSALTILGIIIGIGAVISLMSIGRGAQAVITSQIQGIGTNLLFISPGQATQGRVQGVATLSSLTLADAEALQEGSLAALIVGVAPQVSGGAQAVARNQNLRVQVQGVTPDFLWVRNYNLAGGEFIAESHVTSRALVTVIGSNVASTLFPDTDPVGQTVRINRWTFRIVGVLEAKGGSAFGSLDNAILLPITTMVARLQAQRAIRGDLSVDLINVQIADVSALELTTGAIAELLRDRHNALEDDFTITSQQDIIQTFQQVTNSFTIFLGAIAGISLLVGGIGVMNIMLVSVTERTREIGIRKAVGARRRDILVQFLLESTFLGLVGGAVGVGLGYGLSKIVTQFPIGAQRITTQVSPDIVLLAVSMSLVVGLFFGVYPASRAASLDPIRALRYE